MNRHNARILAVLTMYNYDIVKAEKENILELTQDIITNEKEEEYPVEFDEEYTKVLTTSCVGYLDSIDELITNSLVGYSLSRLSYVDRAIIRIATLEMKFLNVPRKIAINEALEITKEYSNVEDNKQVKFNNKLLDQIANVVYGK